MTDEQGEILKALNKKYAPDTWEEKFDKEHMSGGVHCVDSGIVKDIIRATLIGELEAAVQEIEKLPQGHGIHGALDLLQDRIDKLR